MDNLSQQERSERMSRIKGEDTGPEMTVRRLVHGMGFRYRLHVRDLPGTISGLRSFSKTDKGTFEINGSCIPWAGEP